MLNEEEKITDIVPVENEEELNEAIDAKLVALPLEEEQKSLITSIVEAPTKEELQRQFELFNINQSKKNALRIIKLNNLLDKVEDQAIERFEKRPDQVSNKELLEYMNVVSNQIDRAQRSVDSLSVTPAIHIAAQKNEVNINVGTELDRDSKERVMDAITALLKQVEKSTNPSNNEIIVEAESSAIDADAIIDVGAETNFDVLSGENTDDNVKSDTEVN